MALFSRKLRYGYEVEATTDPDNGEPAYALHSEISGGVVSYHDTEKQARQEADRMAELLDLPDA